MLRPRLWPVAGVATIAVALGLPPAALGGAGASPGVEVDASPPDAPTVFARAAGLSLVSPARRVVAYAYHESLFGTALPMRPSGRPTLVANPHFRAQHPSGSLPRYLVMASRGRGTPATSAVDVVLRRGTRVVAPVTGTVVDVSPYRLYCRRVDWRVIVRPAQRPRLRVVVFHVEHVAVRRGDRVVAGVTPIGVPRVFGGLTAQYDAYVPGDHPHVHVEVERRPTRPLPGCRL